MILPRCSSTTKSRTFSQISAKLRGSRVPSPEYWQIKSWIFSASGRIASRVRMDSLPHGVDLPFGFADRLAHSRRGSAAGDIVDRQDCLYGQTGVEILIKRGVQLTQFL